jgi:hypothetical protein
MPIVLGNSNISYKETKDSINPYNALLFKNQKVGIGVDINSILDNSLEVSGNINIPSSSKYKVNNANFGYSNLDHKLSAGTNISIGADFKINNTYTLPIASSSVIGCVKVGNNLSILGGILSAPTPYILPTASSSVIGGVRVGANLSIDANSILSAPAPIPYTLPTAPTATTTFIATFSGNSPSTHAPIGTNERYMVFTTTGINYTFTVPTGGINCDILLVGGGGGGGQAAGGGGGAGGLIYVSNINIQAGTYSIIVGKGGEPSTNGQNSSFGSLYTAIGGGCGASMDGTPSSGGSGGGGSRNPGAVSGTNVQGQAGASGTIGQGNSGGRGKNQHGNDSGGGGGGGAGAAGASAFTAGRGANGGIGRAINITGTSIYYAGGGGGGTGSDFSVAGTGGSGGGGNGARWNNSGGNASANTGGGGGGGSAYPGYGTSGGSGGSGIVIIRYRAVVNSTFIGCVKIGNNLSIDANGVLSTSTPYTLPTASESVIGGVRVGTNLSITGGVLSAPAPTPYTLPTSSSLVLGGVRVGNNLSIDANGVLSTSTPYTLPIAPEKIIFIATFSDNSPSTHEPIGTNERYMIFTTTDINYTFTVPTYGINCDILLVGGGGGGGGADTGGQGAGTGGGGGDVIYKTNVTLPEGNYVVFVGNGGYGGNYNNYVGGNGSTSSITSTNASFISLFAAGGGGGVSYNQTPGTAPTAGSVIDGNYSSGGGCGGGGTGNGVSGNGGSNGVYYYWYWTYYLAGGGGGAEGNGSNATGASGGNGGSGVSNSILGTVSTYGGGGGGGVATEYPGYGVDGGGGGGYHWAYLLAAAGTPNSGGGGGGGGGNAYAGGAGGSGIVIIRYRNVYYPTFIGGVRVGANLSITGGVLSAPAPIIYTLPTASSLVLGGIRVGDNLSIDANGILSTHTPYTLPIASDAVIGGVRVGANLSITGGVLSAPPPYTLPTASTSVLGGVRVDGTTIAINEGVISYTGGFPNWATSGNNIYNTNTLNVGIGTSNPQSKLHISEESSSTCSLIIQNNRPISTSFIATFSDNSPSTHAAIGTNERYMIFTTPGINYTFAVPTGGVNCSILLVGGGGGGAGSTGGGGGGGGDVIYKTNVTLPEGNCVVFVGNGGSGTYTHGIPGGNGSTSSITSTNASFISLFAAGGGGGGGWAISPGTTPTAGSVANGNYSSGGGGGSGGYLGYSGGTGNGVSGNGGTSGAYYICSGGGGATGNGLNSSTDRGGDGGSGLSVSIIGTATTYGGGGGGGYYNYSSGRRGGYGVDGGGNGLGLAYSGIAPTAGTPNRGGGGGGGGGASPNDYGGGNGGSGIVIIRYRSGETSVANSTIELIRGTSGDANRDFKIGNYNGDFIVKSSINGSDSDYIKMLGTNGAIYNFNNSLYWTQTSDRRIKENIEGASYDKCYENVDKLELKSFNYIKEFKTGNKDTNQLGFIAQEIKDIFPKSVFTNSYNSDELNIPDMHSIDIGQINYTLYGAVKKLMEIKNDKDLRLKRLEDLLNIRGETHSNLIIDTIT